MLWHVFDNTFVNPKRIGDFITPDDSGAYACTPDILMSIAHQNYPTVKNITVSETKKINVCQPKCDTFVI